MGIWSKLFAKKPNKGKEPNKGEKKKVEIKINCPECEGRLTFSRDMTEELWNKGDRRRNFIMAVCKSENAAILLDHSKGHWDWKLIETKAKKKRVEESVVPKSHQPEFVRKERRDNSTYELYKGTDAESARTFLLTKRVDKRLYYIVVETPEGNWGTDVEGLYLERLLPWQTKISSAKCEGHIIPMSWSMFGLEMAAKGYNDNFIAKVQCGKCEHKWLDGVRYQKVTVVSCPKCKMLNKVDSKNIQVVLV